MKKIIYFLLTTLFVGITFSCDDGFLDQVPDDRLTLEQTFSRKSTVLQYLANVYSIIPDEAGQRFVSNNNSGPWTGASDEGEFVWSFVISNSMNVGSWDPTSQFVSTLWSNFYRGIRRSTYFMDAVDQCGDCNATEIERYRAESRALRALYYYHLMRSWGPVILLGDTPIPPDAPVDQLNLARSSYDECVAFVVSELDKAAAVLPVRPLDNQEGRMTKGFALALKAKVLLYAASPLFNGNPDYADLKNNDGKQLISQQYDVNKWKVAADAYKAFLTEFTPGTYSLYRKNNADGQFDPYLSTRDVMLIDWNSEIIMARPAANVGFRQYEMAPFHSGSPSEARGSGGLGATQHIVDAYFMANGKSISDPTSGYVATGFSNFRAPYDEQARETYNPWTNREPRFYVGITYDNSLWLNKNTGLIYTRTWFRGNSGRQVGGNDYTPTGYIVRKNMNLGSTSSSSRSWIMLRLAEVYLDYVEALNEYNPNHPDILVYLNQIRNRAGIPEYGSAALGVPVGQNEMREAIRKERQVELAFEDVRYFDARRWKIAETAFNGPTYGLNINIDDISRFYERVPFEARVFQKRHYLWPIPQDEVNTDRELIQNTGW